MYYVRMCVAMYIRTHMHSSISVAYACETACLCVQVCWYIEICICVHSCISMSISISIFISSLFPSPCPPLSLSVSLYVCMPACKFVCIYKFFMYMRRLTAMRICTHRLRSGLQLMMLAFFASGHIITKRCCL